MLQNVLQTIHHYVKWIVLLLFLTMVLKFRRFPANSIFQVTLFGYGCATDERDESLGTYLAHHYLHMLEILIQFRQNFDFSLVILEIISRMITRNWYTA